MQMCKEVLRADSSQQTTSKVLRSLTITVRTPDLTYALLFTRQLRCHFPSLVELPLASRMSPLQAVKFNHFNHL